MADKARPGLSLAQTEALDLLRSIAGHHGPDPEAVDLLEDSLVLNNRGNSNLTTAILRYTEFLTLKGLSREFADWVRATYPKSGATDGAG